MFEILYDLKFKTIVRSSKPDRENEEGMFWISGMPDCRKDFWDAVSEITFPEAVKTADGPFAVAFFDKKTGDLRIGRDRLGSKQLYYSISEKSVLVSSDFRPTFEFAGGMIDPTALRHYFTFQYVPEPMTIGKNVYALPAGHHASFSEVGIETVRYNRWLPRPVDGKNREEFKKDIAKKFSDAVSRNLSGATCPAAFLSGGLDSSILAGIAAKDHGNLTAYTISFDIPGFSESEVAAKTAEHLGIVHRIVTVDRKSFSEAVPFAVEAMGVPVADPSAVAVSMIAEAVSKGGHDVVLSGEGSDELWCGYHVYDPQGPVTKIMKLPKALKKAIWGVAKHLPSGMRGKDLLKRGCVPLEMRFAGNTFLFDEKEKDKLFAGMNTKTDFKDITAPVYAEMKGFSDMDKMQAIDTNLWLPGDINVVCGKGCEKRGIKCVTPFTDNAVTDLARTLTRDERIKDGRNKVILREAFDDILTDEVKFGKKKGYPVPVRVWLAGELNDWAKEQIASADIGAFINKAYAMELLEKCRRKPDDPLYYRKAWSVVIFAVWYKIFCNKEGNKK